MAKASTLRTRHGAEAEPGDSREGGWGVVVVIAAHMSMAIQVGLLRSWGVVYLSWKEDFETNDKETSAVQSIMSSVMSFSGLPAGVLTQRFGCRITGMIGGGLSSIGLLCSCWVTDIHQFYITAFFTGVGIGICYNSTIVVVALYFKRKYKIANAVACSGLGTGIMAVPPIVQLLLESYGWRGAFLVASAIAANSIALSACYRPNHYMNNNKKSCREHDGLEHEPTREVNKGIHNNKTDFVTLNPKSSNSIVKYIHRLSVTLGFQLFLKSYRLTLQSAIQLQYCLVYVGFVLYLVPRAQSVGVAPSTAAMLLSIFGIGSLLGRLGGGLLVSWRISAEHVSTISLVLAGMSVLLLNFESYYIFAIAAFLHGFASGVFFSIVVVLSRSFIGVRKLAIGVGISQIWVGIGSVTGPILAGWILDTTGESYQTFFYVAGAICFICAVQMFFLPLLRRVEPGIDILPTDA
ncbi:monocarboxylate transporter 12-like [Patiria miniata]|uniref:Major facilitator superfamily (MFS) profile domain-containing protein n=1 Tax=Patiria miniata TaxID=46514 RepID=A0A913ZHG6_PATMI|nr:monocarboxylate transporter 12-like [Patiria miniata]